jgi:hypothetical protein
MIPFFRKIRKQFADDNKPLKYMRYAIGEIILVVIGILIALSINNWNESRIKNNSVKSHLESLTEAIDHDIRELSISMEFNEFRFHSWQYLLKMSGVYINSLQDIPRPDTYIVNVWGKPYPDEISKDFVDESMQQLNDAFLGMFFNYSAINEINNLGIISEIDNDSIKMKINEYYYHLDWKFGEQQVNRRYKLAENLKNYLRDKFAISSTYPPDPQRIFEIIREDKKTVIMMRELIMTANDHYWQTQELRELGRKLVDMLNKEIAKG